MKPSVAGLRLPEFPNLTWINSPPLRAADLEGRVLLVDFWDYAGTNCLRALPYVRAWHERYQDAGLVVVGIHAPEFPFGKDPAQVGRAVTELDLRYPIALDNEFLAWHAFHNSYWPAKYLFDAGGGLRYFHFGEGDYEACERALQECLAEVHPDRAWPCLLYNLTLPTKA
jgi:thiol-disulfide isomerase/thioredoxin